MSTPLQNRLVGTVIVAAAAVIFLPSFFDGEKKAYQAQFESIPTHSGAVNALEIKDFDHQDFAAELNKPETLSTDEPADDQLTSVEKSVATEQGEQVEVVAKSAAITEQANKQNKQSDVPETEPKTTATTSTVTTATAFGAQNVAMASEVTSAVSNASQSAQAYVIQLGSFANKNNVNTLMSKLKQAGYTAFTRPIKTKAGNLTKVFIGPELNSKSLEAKIGKLKALTGVQGKLAKFEPISN
ncbi:SPOR domain-containing protein [Thalassotalea ponticola]|uniref:SPOR domain-containing protein n=1 Tax=Thalassotalea ponticola TaxID=1523392 RepID=UPI0025B40D9C|nr:SPOR domain-containing protein [Thalassotalea ponticola]MDN3653162.1 SPOR domain-containing protein [Thalassotalea ponticola]